MQSPQRDPSKANRVLILEQLLDGRALSRIELARETGLSPATVGRLISTLLSSQLLKEVGSDQETGGRPSQLVQFDPDSRLVASVDITQDTLEGALVNLRGEVVHRELRPVSKMGPVEKAGALRAMVSHLSSLAPSGSLVAAGASVPGPVTEKGSVTLAPAVQWYNFPLAEHLDGASAVPVVIENDVNLIAYGEYFRGLGASVSSLLAIGVFQGVGAGIVENGRLWRGQGGAAGQFGRMLMDVSGLREDRKGFGQVERHLGEDALRDRALQAAIRFSDDASADSLFEKVLAGDRGSTDLFNTAMDEYAFQLVNLSAILAPEVIVFDGLFGRWSHLVIPALEERLQGNVLHPSSLRQTCLGGDAKLIGAALYALDQRGGVLELA